MGFNIAGFLTNNQLNSKEKLEEILETKLEYTEEISGEVATMSKYSSEFDVYENQKGSFVLLEIGQIYDFSNTKGEFIQFIISDVSDTYYFEKYKDGVIERKLILSQGEIVEEKGCGIINENDDFMDKISEISNELLDVDDIFELKFKRFKV